jgi:hypothetical protein
MNKSYQWVKFIFAVVLWIVTVIAVSVRMAHGQTAPTLYDFGASWCGPCREMAKTVNDLERAGYPVRRINIDREPQVKANFKVGPIPCFVVVKDGQEYGRRVGVCTLPDLWHMFDRWRPKAIAPKNLMVEAGQRLGVASIRTGRRDPLLERLAQGYANYMAARNAQGFHEGWSERYATATEALRDYSAFREISAESWPWQNEVQSATEMFTSWRQSPGHWSVANGPCRIYGYAMARGRNGTFYGVGIIGR